MPKHIYDIWVWDNYLFYTDWRKGSVNLLLLDTKVTKVIAENLMRPTQIAVVYTAEDLKKRELFLMKIYSANV